VRHVDDAQGPEDQGEPRRHYEQVGGIGQPAHREQQELPWVHLEFFSFRLT